MRYKGEFVLQLEGVPAIFKGGSYHSSSCGLLSDRTHKSASEAKLFNPCRQASD